MGDPVSGHWRSKKEVFTHIKNGFRLANKYQIRIIPFIQMGSHWVDWCSQTGKYQTGHSTGLQTNGVAWIKDRIWFKDDYRCPAMADETGIDGGIDDIFVEFYN
jgi:hypothetical protein